VTKKKEAAEKTEATEKAAPAKVAAKAAAPSRVTLTQLRAALDTKQHLALRGLGLRRIRHTVSVVDTPSTRGLILKVRHLVEVKA
jgi:large subunit ribosomal protein L30